MKFLSWNVNGWRASVKKGLYDFLKTETPDIIGIQEIKFHEKPELPPEVSNYHLFWNAAEKKGYAGTAILSNKTPLSISKGLGIEKFDKEGRVITAEFEKFFFITAYFPNSQHGLKRLDFKLEFNTAILNYVKNLEKKKPVIICGDFNVAHQELDIARPKSNINNPGFTKSERDWMTLFIKSAQIDTFRELHPKKIQYSWWSYRSNARQKNIGWRIDYFSISKQLLPNLEKSFILDQVQGSDHAPVGIKMNLS